MIDLHTHTVFSDGELIPAELIRRYVVLGCEGLAITDHADPSNLDTIAPRLSRALREMREFFKIPIIAGVELTHNPPEMIDSLVKKARRMGAAIVVVHGETLSEPVAPGTNRAAIEAGADVLAHPGLISEEEVKLAAEKGVLLEISGRKGHCLGNGRLAALARKCGAKLVIDSDSHAPGDLFTPEAQKNVGLGAGLTPEEIDAALKNAMELINKIKVE